MSNPRYTAANTEVRTFPNGVKLVWDLERDTYVLEPEEPILKFLAYVILTSYKPITAVKLAKMLGSRAHRLKHHRDFCDDVFDTSHLPRTRKFTGKGKAIDAATVREILVTRHLCTIRRLPIHGTPEGFKPMVDAEEAPKGMITFDGADRSVEGRIKGLATQRASKRQAQAINAGDLDLLNELFGEDGKLKTPDMVDRAERLEDQRDAQVAA